MANTTAWMQEVEQRMERLPRRKSMRKVRQVLRLAWEAGLGQRQIGRSLGMSPATVGEYVRRAQLAGLSWPLPDALDDAELETRMFPPPLTLALNERTLPNWAEVNAERKRKGVTLVLLWQEYKAAHPEGLQYSQYCDRYRAWKGQLDLVMRQHHRAGEKLFVDYAGQTVPVIDRSTGEERQAEIFVATLGASNYTYAEASWTQALPEWISSHIHAFEYFGSVPSLLIPDNLKSAVTTPCRYEPLMNATYEEMAEHYATAILPARVRRPRDKAKVEVGVLLVERWILARLRHHRFFSLHELNEAIAPLLEALNTHAFKKLPGCRRTLFEQLDRPAMKPLPAARYVYAEWRITRVHVDYHLEVDGHYYSVPYQLVSRELDIRLSVHTVECFHHGKRVASHRRSHLKGRHTTVTEHMPRAHREYAQWTPQRLVRWARTSGAATAEVVATSHAHHPSQSPRRALLPLKRRGGRAMITPHRAPPTTAVSRYAGVPRVWVEPRSSLLALLRTSIFSRMLAEINNATSNQ